MTVTPQPAQDRDENPTTRPEQTVVVVFDVYADTREDAARKVADLLRRGGTCDVLADPQVDAWWFPEAWAMHIDGNDRGPMSLTY